MGVWKYSSTHS